MWELSGRRWQVGRGRWEVGDGASCRWEVGGRSRGVGGGRWATWEGGKATGKEGQREGGGPEVRKGACWHEPRTWTDGQVRGYVFDGLESDVGAAVESEVGRGLQTC